MLISDGPTRRCAHTCNAHHIFYQPLSHDTCPTSVCRASLPALSDVGASKLWSPSMDYDARDFKQVLVTFKTRDRSCQVRHLPHAQSSGLGKHASDLAPNFAILILNVSRSAK